MPKVREEVHARGFSSSGFLVIFSVLAAVPFRVLAGKFDKPPKGWFQFRSTSFSNGLITALILGRCKVIYFNAEVSKAILASRIEQLEQLI